MKQKKLWMLATLVCGASVLTSCSNSDNSSKVNTTVLTEWQAGKTVDAATVDAFGGIEKCFAAEPIPDGVWARMQGKTYKENPYIGRDNNSSCFCYRNIAGSTNLSKHARGLAIDINTLYNPYYKVRDDGSLFIQPATAEAYCNRDWDFPYKIDHDDLCFRLFTAAGFEWGGDWTTRKDYQHFEWIEE